jgi:hypothetical protein
MRCGPIAREFATASLMMFSEVGPALRTTQRIALSRGDRSQAFAIPVIDSLIGLVPERDANKALRGHPDFSFAGGNAAGRDRGRYPRDQACPRCLGDMARLAHVDLTKPLWRRGSYRVSQVRFLPKAQPVVVFAEGVCLHAPMSQS